MDRNTLLTDHPRPIQENQHKWSFFTTFSIQHRQIKEIFNKHWKVLKSYRYLGPIIPERAIYRGARSIQRDIATNVIDPLEPFPFPTMQGLLPLS